MWIFSWKGESGFSACSTAEEVTNGIDGSGLVAIVTGEETNTPQTVGNAPTGNVILDQPAQMPGQPVSFFGCIEYGASSGIGVETTRVLALRGVQVVMAVRNVAAGMGVKAVIVKEIPTAKIDVMELDLSSMASVRKFASEFTSLGLPLNILINNAGVMACPFMLSQDNIELQFATNHLGHFLLTKLLLETMKETSHKSSIEGRIVNLSSDGHKLAYREGIRFDKINDESGYSSFFAYGQSKLSNILHANELARQLEEEGVNITANSLHPGAIVTNLLRHHGFVNGIANMLGRFVLKNIPQGAATTCYVALHPDIRGVRGKYFKDSNIAATSSHATDKDLAKKLWDYSLRLTQ